MASLCAIGLGCSDSESASKGQDIPAGAGKCFLKDMAPSDVFAIVNGRKLTKGDYLDYWILAERLFRFSKGISMAVADPKVSRHMALIEWTLPAELISRQLMLSGAEKAGVTVTADDRAAAEKQVLKSLGRGATSLDAVARKIGSEEGKRLKRMVEENALMNAFRRQSTTNNISTVSAEDVKAAQDRIAKWNANADRQNERSRKKAQKFREAAMKPGADFEKMTHQHAKVSPEFGKFWESFQLGELEDGEPLKIWLAAAKEGDISEPIDLDDGIAVVKLLKKTVTPIPGETSVVVDYDLARCTFYAYQHLKEQTDKELADDILATRIKAVQKELGTRLWNEAVFEYPHGDQFFPDLQPGRKTVKEAEKGKEP